MPDRSFFSTWDWTTTTATMSTWLRCSPTSSRMGWASRPLPMAQPARSLLDFRAFGTISFGHQHRPELDRMTAAQRAASALNEGHLVWNGANVATNVPIVLQKGAPALTVTSPASVAGSYLVGTASFGPALSSPGVTAEVMPVVDTAPNLGLACNPLSALNAAAVNGKIAMVDRGCTFNVKGVQRSKRRRGRSPRSGQRRRHSSSRAWRYGLQHHHSLPPHHSGRRKRVEGCVGNAVLVPLGNVCQPGRQIASSMHHIKHQQHPGRPFAGADAAARAWMYAPNPFQSGSSRFPFTSPSMACSRRQKSASRLSRRALAPSDSAFSGASCTSTNTPSTPAATAARASGSINSGWPLDALPAPPGSWTLCVASNTTGQPASRMIFNPRISTTRLL